MGFGLSTKHDFHKSLSSVSEHSGRKSEEKPSQKIRLICHSLITILNCPKEPFYSNKVDCQIM